VCGICVGQQHPQGLRYLPPKFRFFTDLGVCRSGGVHCTAQRGSNAAIRQSSIHRVPQALQPNTLDRTPHWRLQPAVQGWTVSCSCALPAAGGSRHMVRTSRKQYDLEGKHQHPAAAYNSSLNYRAPQTMPAYSHKRCHTGNCTTARCAAATSCWQHT
jgi:hypothetical protein